MSYDNLAFRCLLSLLSLIGPAAASAQDQYDDPPARVARISYTSGAVSFEPAGTQDWVDAMVNRPMTTGDRLWADRGSRAALHIGSASIHLSENTGFSFLNLTDNVAQLQLTAGTLRVRVKRLAENENFEIDAPNLAFSVLRPGIYEIRVNEAGDTTVIEDRRGEGEVTGGGSSYTVHAGELDTFTGLDQLNADMEPLASSDDFERWSEQRDHHEDISVSARYVSDDAIGYDDLDDNGGWRPVPDYGMVWFPHSVVGQWAPYHSGHWAYIAPWGYTWVDDAPWGFAPFHYGRWVNVSNNWGWVPCPPRREGYSGSGYVAPVYAPALVAWIGGANFGVGISLGSSVGWFPLGPREVYVPSYPVRRDYFNRVNISSTTVNTTVINNYYTNVIVNKQVNVTNVTYVNQRVPGGVTATTSQAFSSGRPVANNAVRVDPRQVASAPVAVLTPRAVPQPQSVLGGRGPVNVRPPAALQARAVVVKTAPPPPPPTFAKRQEAIQSNQGRPLSLAQERQISPQRAQEQAAVPQVRIAPPAKPGVPAKVGVATQTRPANAPATPVQNQRPNNGPPPDRTAAQPAAVRPAPNVPQATSPAPNRPAPNQPAANQVAPNQPVPNRPQANRPAAIGNADRPPTAQPAPARMEQQHQQQNIQLHQQQDQQYQKLQQQQQQEQQRLQQEKADQARQQQVQQQHQQQLEQLEKQHQQQQQQMQQRQEQEHQRLERQPQPPPPPPPARKPAEKPKEDRPPQK